MAVTGVLHQHDGEERAKSVGVGRCGETGKRLRDPEPLDERLPLYYVTEIDGPIVRRGKYAGAYAGQGHVVGYSSRTGGHRKQPL